MLPWSAPALLWILVHFLHFVLRFVTSVCLIHDPNTLTLALTCTLAAFITHPLYTKGTLPSSFLVFANIIALSIIQIVLVVAKKEYHSVYTFLGVPNLVLISCICKQLVTFCLVFDARAFKRETWNMYTIFLPMIVIPQVIFLVVSQDLNHN